LFKYENRSSSFTIILQQVVCFRFKTSEKLTRRYPRFYHLRVSNQVKLMKQGVLKVTEKQKPSAVLCVGGSPRAGGNSDILIQHFLTGIRLGGSVAETVQLRDYNFQSCTGCEQCRKDKTCTGLSDDMGLIYPKFESAKSLVLVSPVHNYNITAIMKAFIDRLYCYYDFAAKRPGEWSTRLQGQGRKAVIAVVAEQKTFKDSGVDPALQALRLPFEALGYEIVAELPVTGVFHKGRIRNYPEILEKARQIGIELTSSV